MQVRCRASCGPAVTGGPGQCSDWRDHATVPGPPLSGRNRPRPPESLTASTAFAPYRSPMAVSTVHAAPPSALGIETESSQAPPAWRAWVLPGVALAWLVVGSVAWLQGSSALADRIWFVGLVVLGAPVVLGTVRQALRGQFATDLVATLAIVTAIVLVHPLAGLVVLLMQTGGEALDKFAEGRASAAVRALEEDAPRIAHRLRGDLTRAEDVPVDAVAVDDLLLV